MAEGATPPTALPLAGSAAQEGAWERGQVAVAAQGSCRTRHWGWPCPESLGLPRGHVTQVHVQPVTLPMDGSPLRRPCPQAEVTSPGAPALPSRFPAHSARPEFRKVLRRPFQRHSRAPRSERRSVNRSSRPEPAEGETVPGRRANTGRPGPRGPASQRADGGSEGTMQSAPSRDGKQRQGHRRPSVCEAPAGAWLRPMRVRPSEGFTYPNGSRPRWEPRFLQSASASPKCQHLCVQGTRGMGGR